MPGGPGLPLCRGHVDHNSHHPPAIVKYTILSGKKLDKVVTEGVFQPVFKMEKVSVLNLQETTWLSV